MTFLNDIISCFDLEPGNCLYPATGEHMMGKILLTFRRYQL